MNSDPNSFHSAVIGMDEPMNSHRELFNKLVASQSQPTILTASNSINEPDYHQTSDYDTRCSSAIEQSTYQLAQRPNQQAHNQLHQTLPPQRRCSSLSGPSSSPSSSGVTDKQQQHTFDYRNICDLLPEDFRKEPVAFLSFRNRWYTNEEVASILTNTSSHAEWQTNELQVRPKSGAVFLYSREKVRYRLDGYCWKKRKNGRTTREDHMKLKVQGVECIYGCYVHSAILPTFHRRCYWLLQNPDTVLVHYLNQPAEDQNKMMITFNSISLEAFTRRSWTNEEIIEEIGSVFGGISQIKHMLNINIAPEANALFQQPHQQLHQQSTATTQQPQSQQQQLHSQSNELLVMPTDSEHLPNHNGISTCGNTIVAADDTTQQTNSSSSMDLLALSDSFGPGVAQFQDEPLDHQQSRYEQSPSYPNQVQQLNHQQNQNDRIDMNVGEMRNTDFSADENQDLLLDEFNLQTSSLGQVDEELVSNVIESLSDVEDLRDLFAGITSSNNCLSTMMIE